MPDNRLPRTVRELSLDITYYLETKAGIRPALSIDQKRKQIGETVAKLIDLRIETNLEEVDLDSEEWWAMDENNRELLNLGYALVSVIDAQIKQTPRLGAPK